MYYLKDEFIQEVAEATDNNEHTWAVQMIAGLLGSEQFVELRLEEIARRQRQNGSISDADYAERNEHRAFLLHLLEGEISNIADLRAAF